MAQIEATNTTLSFSMFDVIFTGFVALDSTSSSHYSWIAGDSSPFSYRLTALSFSSNIALGSPPTGEINALAFQANSGFGYNDVFSITDMNASLNLLVDPANANSMNESFWEEVMKGDSVVLAPDVTPAIANFQAQFCGDFFTAPAGNVTGGNDRFVGGRAFGLNQTFYGDALAAFANTVLTGGNDHFTIGTAGIAIGDVGANGGEVVGGDDTFIVSGSNIDGSFIGDVAQGAGKLTGGDDTFIISDAGSQDREIALVVGDAASTGTVASTGGVDTITISNTLFDQDVESVISGDFKDGLGEFDGAGDTITLTNLTTGSGITNFLVNVYGDGGATNSTARGGNDSITVSNLSTGSNFDLLSGDIRSISNGLFLGGGDTITVTNHRFLSIAGDALTSTTAGGYQGGADTITLTYNVNRVLDLNVYGEGQSVVGAVNMLGGNDQITLNDNVFQSGNITITGDVRTFDSFAGQYAGGSDTITYNGTHNVTIFGDVENLVLANVFGGGADTLRGGSGNDIIYGDVAASGGAGLLLGGNDTIDGRDGNDNIFGDFGSDQLTGGLGDDIIYGDGVVFGPLGTDIDTALFNTVDQSVYVDLLGIAGTGFPGNAKEAMGQGFDDLFGIENIVGSARNDVIRGTDGVNVLSGGGGADRLEGRLGADTLRGDAGVDLLLGGGDGDILEGGNDGDHLYGGLGADQHIGGNDAGIDYARYDDANYGNLTIRLDGGANVGAAAVGDTYIGIEGLVGGLGVDIIVGNASANFLFGGGNNDYIDGRAGNDYMNGGAGADRFVFATALGAGNVDNIADFQHLTDDIVLNTSIFSAVGASLTIDEFRIGSAQDPNDYILYNNITGALYYDSNGNLAGGITQFATVTAGTTLTFDDFIVA